MSKLAIEIGGKTGKRYSRDDLEALRFVNFNLQREKWREIYVGFDSRVSKEYDELIETAQKRLWERRKEPLDSDFGCNDESFENDDDGGDDFDDDDSDDEYDSIQRPAFCVEGEPDYESGSPQDGWEYLKRVRWEAAQMPKVKIANVDRSTWSDEQTPYMPKIPEIAKCPENLRPSKLWVDQFLADFSDLRKAFSDWEISPDRINITSASTQQEISGETAVPTLSAILKMDPVSRSTNLRNRIKSFESAASLSDIDCQWIFAMCAAIDLPLDAEMASCMRRLLRKCSSLLAKKIDPFEEEVARLNILIAITGRFFGQSEEI